MIVRCCCRKSSNWRKAMATREPKATFSWFKIAHRICIQMLVSLVWTSTFRKSYLNTIKAIHMRSSPFSCMNWLIGKKCTSMSRFSLIAFTWYSLQSASIKQSTATLCLPHSVSPKSPTSSVCIYSSKFGVSVEILSCVEVLIGIREDLNQEQTTVQRKLEWTSN